MVKEVRSLEKLGFKLQYVQNFTNNLQKEKMKTGRNDIPSTLMHSTFHKDGMKFHNLFKDFIRLTGKFSMTDVGNKISRKQHNIAN